jgi:hypothetical protein
MIKTDLKRNFNEVKWLTQHTLSEEQRKQVFRDKLERAERMQLKAKAQEERKLYA